MRNALRLACLVGAGALLAAPLAAQEGKPQTREVWAAQPIPETPYKAPNRLIWRIADILASHKGQQSWVQPVVRTRDFAGDYVSMAPGEKTKTSFYADDRLFWWVQGGQMLVTIEARRPSPRRKGFLVDVAPRLAYSIENNGSEPVVFFRVSPNGEMPSYPISETPTPLKGWKFIRAQISDTGTYDDTNKPYLDFNKDVVAVNGKSSNFVYDGTRPRMSFADRAWIRRPMTNGAISTRIWWSSGACWKDGWTCWCRARRCHRRCRRHHPRAEERWHRATSHPGAPSTRLAITPRLKEGQVHYFQPGSSGN